MKCTPDSSIGSLHFDFETAIKLFLKHKMRRPTEHNETRTSVIYTTHAEVGYMASLI